MPAYIRAHACSMQMCVVCSTPGMHTHACIWQADKNVDLNICFSALYSRSILPNCIYAIVKTFYMTII